MGEVDATPGQPSIPPRPMSPGMRASLGVSTFEDERFMYGDWVGSWQYYHEKWPGFSVDECKVLELHSRGMRAKEHKQLVKKEKKKSCSRLKKQAN